MTEEALAALQDVLGHRFAAPDLLRLALTHSSASSVHNEALACLGDRIHNVCVARRVYAALPGASKGELTWQINQLCMGGTQAELFFELGLHRFLLVGGAITGSYGQVTEKMAATAWEAVVAALELDGGREVAEAFLARAIEDRLAALAEPPQPPTEGEE